MKTLIIDNFDSFTYNLYQLVTVITGGEVIVKRNNEISLEQVQKLEAAHIILSPGPGNPANTMDFGVCSSILQNIHLLGSKLLGVCLGHQGIVHQAGGSIVKAPLPVHGKTSPLRILRPSKLLEGIPDGSRVMRYHSLVADRKDLPDSLEVLADEADTGLVMAVQSKCQNLYGVQFHPESVATIDGKRIMENFLNL